MSIADLSIASQEDANEAISALDQAALAISDQRTNIGAVYVGILIR